jgi:hypothetical protein
MRPVRSLRRRSLILSVSIATIACADSITAAARPIAGCYRLQSSPLPGASISLAPLPDTVRLFDARGQLALEDGRALLRAWPDSQRTGYRWSWWEVASPDTLTLVFSRGFDGARLALRPAGDGFYGEMATFSDVEPALSRVALARLTPIVCAGAA